MPKLSLFEEFLYEEARLLDEWRLKDWLELWVGPGSVYWIPAGNEDSDPETELQLVYADWTGLNQRLARLESGYAEDQNPQPRLIRHISNVREVGGGDGEHTVTSTFILGEYRPGALTVRDRMFMGRYIHNLQQVSEGQFRIKSKKVILLNSADYIGPVTFPF